MLPCLPFTLLCSLFSSHWVKSILSFLHTNWRWSTFAYSEMIFTHLSIMNVFLCNMLCNFYTTCNIFLRIFIFSLQLIHSIEELSLLNFFAMWDVEWAELLIPFIYFSWSLEVAYVVIIVVYFNRISVFWIFQLTIWIWIEIECRWIDWYRLILNRYQCTLINILIISVIINIE